MGLLGRCFIYWASADPVEETNTPPLSEMYKKLHTFLVYVFFTHLRDFMSSAGIMFVLLIMYSPKAAIFMISIIAERYCLVTSSYFSRLDTWSNLSIYGLVLFLGRCILFIYIYIYIAVGGEEISLMWQGEM